MLSTTDNGVQLPVMDAINVVVEVILTGKADPTPNVFPRISDHVVVPAIIGTYGT